MACSAGCFGPNAWASAVNDGDEEAMRLLLTQDIRHAKRSVGKGLTAWHYAAARGNLQLIQLLVDTVRNASPESLDILTNSLRRYISALPPADPDVVLLKFTMLPAAGGMSPLMVAAQEGQHQVVELLLGMGADPWQHDRFGLTALHHAARKGHVPVIQHLLQHPTPPSARACRTVHPGTKYVDCMDIAGWAPLHYAVYRQHLEAVSCLISSDANLMARSLVHHDIITSLPPGSSPLHVAASQGNLPMIQLILRAYYESCADLLPNHLGTVERRRRQRSQPDPRLILSRTGRLAFHVALRFGQNEVLEWLDPSIPLMFLLSGSDDAAPGGAGGGQGGGGAGGQLSVANVPRLAVLAAKALHALLIASLDRVEQELQEKEKQQEQQKLAAEQQKASMAKQAHRFRSMLDRVTGKANREEAASSQAAAPSASRRTSRLSRGKAKSQRTLIVQASGRRGSDSSGPTNLRILQILASGNIFERRSDYQDQNQRMGIAIPSNPVEEPIAVLRLANAPRAPVAAAEPGGPPPPLLPASPRISRPGAPSARASGTGAWRARHSDPGNVQHIVQAMRAEEAAAAAAATAAAAEGGTTLTTSATVPELALHAATAAAAAAAAGPSPRGSRRQLSTSVSMSAAPSARAAADEAETETSSLPVPDPQTPNFQSISIIGGLVPWAQDNVVSSMYIGASGLSRSVRHSEPGRPSDFTFTLLPGGASPEPSSPPAEAEGPADAAGGGSQAALECDGAAAPLSAACSSPLQAQEGSTGPAAAAGVGQEPADGCGGVSPDELASSTIEGAVAVLLAQLPGCVDDEAQGGCPGGPEDGGPVGGPPLEGVFADAASSQRGLRAGGFDAAAGGGDQAGGAEGLVASSGREAALIVADAGDGNPDPGLGGEASEVEVPGRTSRVEVTGMATGELLVTDTTDRVELPGRTSRAGGAGRTSTEVEINGRTSRAEGPGGPDLVEGAQQRQQAADAGGGETTEVDGLGGLLSTITKHLKKMSAQVVPLRQSTLKPRPVAGPSNLSRRTKSFTPSPQRQPLSPDDSGSEGGSFSEQVVVGAEGAGGDDSEEEDACPVCLDELPNVALDKCKHKLCLGCSRDLCNRYRLTPALCPCCRSIISGFRLE